MAARDRTATQIARDFVTTPAEPLTVVPELPIRAAVGGCDRVTVVVGGELGTVTIAYVPVTETLEQEGSREIIARLVGNALIMLRPESLCAALATALVAAIHPVSYRVEVHVRYAKLDVAAVAER